MAISHNAGTAPLIIHLRLAGGPNYCDLLPFLRPIEARANCSACRAEPIVVIMFKKLCRQGGNPFPAPRFSFFAEDRGPCKSEAMTNSQVTKKYSVGVARGGFLNAIADQSPRVLATLRSDVFPHFARLFEIRQTRARKLRVSKGLADGVSANLLEYGPEQLVLHRVSKEELRRYLNDPAASPQISWSRDLVEAVDPNRILVRDKLAKWGAIWRLTDEWVYDTALNTMTRWLTRPSLPNVWDLVHHWGIAPKDEPPSLTIHEEWWFEPWNQFQSRIQDQIDAFRSTIEAYHRRVGFDREAVGNKPYHPVWLALFQVERKSPDSIRAWHKDKYGVQLAESAVTKGYTRLASRIGLTLRTKLPHS